MATSTSIGGQMAFNDGVNAPVSGVGGAQVNAAEGIVVRSGKNTSLHVDRSSTDTRNYGQQLGNIGAGANVHIETLSDDVAMTAMLAQNDTARAALDANVSAQRDALTAAQNLGGMSYAFADSVLARMGAAEDNRRIETLEVINSARQQTEQAGIRSENALNKLAEQRAPDGAATAKTLMVLVIAGVVLGLAWIFRRRSTA